MYLDKEHISFIQAISFEEALYKCGKPLLDKGIIEKSYLEQILQLVEEEGFYFILLEKIAFAHHNPKHGSNEVGLSIVVLEQPIKCNEIEMKVMILLSGKDNENHLKLLQFVSNKLRNGQDKDLLEAQTIDEVYSIFKD